MLKYYLTNKMFRSAFQFIIVSQCLVMSDDRNIAVLILARGGSKGVKLKNIQTVAGRSLLTQSIHTARLAGLVDITVSTDHFQIAVDALRGGAKIVRRSKVTASDSAPSIWGAQEFLSKRPEIDVLVLLQCTSPFVKASSLKKGVHKLYSPAARDCVFAVTRIHKLRWKFIEGALLPVNFRLESRPRRQDWEGDLVEAGAFYVTKADLIREGLFQNLK